MRTSIFALAATLLAASAAQAADRRLPSKFLGDWCVLARVPIPTHGVCFIHRPLAPTPRTSRRAPVPTRLTVEGSRPRAAGGGTQCKFHRVRGLLGL
jgi:hypothetical protein